jgi:hypothetical protein
MSNFPTGKPHVSYSEIRTWKECSWKHKKFHIEKIDLSAPSPFLFFGTIIHAACEEYLKTRVMHKEIAEKAIRDAWENNGFESVEEWVQNALNIMEDLPAFLDETFPGWECVSAEEALYEAVTSHDINFKGFVDAIIKVPVKGEKSKYWMIDWKTSGPAGWRVEKQRDFLVQAQLALYKYHWMRKKEMDSKDISCGFVLLKKGAKLGKTCQLIEMSAGPKTMEKAAKLMTDMVATVRKGIAIKNRLSCTYCEYKGTPHCT